MLKLTNYDLNKNLMSCTEIKLYYSRKGVLKKCHRSYWQSGNKITPYIVATFEWYKILFAMIIHEGY